MITRLIKEENAQDTFEYLLTVAVGAVALVTILYLGFQVMVPKILKHLCPTVDPIDDFAGTGCLTP